MREGGIWFAIAYLPTFSEFIQSVCQSFNVVLLALLLAFVWETLKGVCRSRSVASFANWSALSLPGMPQWLGHQAIDTERFLWVVRRGWMVW